jgi:hypothetical protein
MHLHFILAHKLDKDGLRQLYKNSVIKYKFINYELYQISIHLQQGDDDNLNLY